MAPRRVAAGLELLDAREPLGAVPRHRAHEVIEEHVLALHAPETPPDAQGTPLPHHPAGMMLAEVDRFFQRQRGVECQRALVQAAMKRARVDRVANDVHAAAGLDETLPLWVAT